MASLATPRIKSVQDYDVSVTLSLPPSRPNEERGNFMVSLHLLDRDATPQVIDAAHKFSRTSGGQQKRGEAVQLHPTSLGSGSGGAGVIFSSRRPALVPYVDPIVSTASRTLFLLYHMVFPEARTHRVTVPLAERVSFARGASVPLSALVVVEAGQELQTYAVSLDLTARLTGLRWLMHHYRLPTYLVATFFFWACEVLFMGLVWALWTSATGGPSPTPGKLDQGSTDESDSDDAKLLPHKEEEANSSSDDAVVATALRKREPGVKKEEAGREVPLSELPLAGAEADDERDAGSDTKHGGASTSYREEGSGQVRRRDSGRQGSSS